MKQSKYDEAEKKFQTFNWTKVELKLVPGNEIYITLKTFNWTKVELKLDFAEASEGWDVSFNWTKVELKHH